MVSGKFFGTVFSQSKHSLILGIYLLLVVPKVVKLFIQTVYHYRVTPFGNVFNILHNLFEAFFFFFLVDINKFLWMVRIGGSTERGKHIKEWDYYSPAGEFRVDSGGSATMLNSLMYKLCYYNFGKVYSEGS